MNGDTVKLWVIGMVVMVCISCVQQAPQRPSRRMGATPEPDSAALALLEMNRQLALSADQQVAQAAQAQEETFALYDNNTWIAVTARGDEHLPAPKEGDQQTVRMRVYNLSGTILEDTEGSYRIGKGELPAGIDANIGELHRGGKARMIIPWYAAYGIQGTEHVPPYENVLIDIELK